MMTSLGHDVFLYSGTKNEATVTEHITVVDDDDRRRWFSHYDWDRMVFNDWDVNAACWVGMNLKVVAEIEKRKLPGDFLGLIGGVCQEPIARAHRDLRAVEWGVGYEGILKEGHHVFESHAWMHYVYGQSGIKDGRFFDAVIPNSFDEDDYQYSAEKQDYLLYLGRLTPRKGLEVVKELAALGHKIIAAGQGDINIDGVEHVGVVKGRIKASLLAHAKALLAPTFYIEPFGGVVVEALLSGTPVITTDFGAFTETVRDGVDGYRCHTIGEFDEAATMVESLDLESIREHAEQYLTKNIRHKYDAYFRRLELLDGQGWYSH